MFCSSHTVPAKKNMWTLSEWLPASSWQLDVKQHVSQQYAHIRAHRRHRRAGDVLLGMFSYKPWFCNQSVACYFKILISTAFFLKQHFFIWSILWFIRGRTYSPLSWLRHNSKTRSRKRPSKLSKVLRRSYNESFYTSGYNAVITNSTRANFPTNYTNYTRAVRTRGLTRVFDERFKEDYTRVLTRALTRVSTIV